MCSSQVGSDQPYRESRLKCRQSSCLYRSWVPACGRPPRCFCNGEHSFGLSFSNNVVNK